MAEAKQTWLEDRLLSGVERIWGRDRLTVLAYHRIRNPSGFPFFEPVISATPNGFARQMDIVSQKYNAISLADLHGWLDGGTPLPPRAALVTFDDGYRDNLEFALPILQERGLPAVVFLSTDYVSRDRPFFWDAAAFCFRNTERSQADLPILGVRTWASASSISTEWIEAMKRQPDDRKDEAVAQLGALLDVRLPADIYAGELLTWDEVRSMMSKGFSFGSHTLSHTILTQLPPDQALRELKGSRLRLEDELDAPVRSLAYPNGTTADFSPQIEELAREAGYTAAFTMVPGPARSRAITANPMAIRRVSLYLDDSDRRFRAKLAGGGRIRSSLS